MKRKTILHKEIINTPWLENSNQQLRWSTVFSDVIRERHLTKLLAWRSISVRTKQSFFGHLWPILNPLVSSIVFLIVFNKIAGVDSDPIPYFVFAYTGSMIWNYVSSTSIAGTNSFIINTGIITKTYFPRVILPVSSCIAGFYNLTISTLFLLPLMLAHNIELNLALLTLPIWIFLLFILALGFSLVFGTLNVIYRDIGQVANYLCQTWMYASPIAYPAGLIPEQYKLLFYINPLAGILEGIRWAILGTDLTVWSAVSVITLAALLITGVYCFGKNERILADHL